MIIPTAQNVANRILGLLAGPFVEGLPSTSRRAVALSSAVEPGSGG
jgi:hypothetical protein